MISVDPKTYNLMATSSEISRLPIPSGILVFSARDLIDAEKEKIPVPKRLVKALSEKWTKIFRFMVAKHPTIREFTAPITNLPFTNRFNVSWQPPQISIDILQKNFRISARPSSRQDQLCFEPAYDPGFNISLTGKRLSLLFKEFFETINQARWCSNCGEFSWNYAYISELEICDHCLMEEICAFSKSETQHCTICMENGKRMYKTRCGHYFHRSCLSKIESVDFGPKCPVCRTYLDIHDERISEASHEAENEEI